MVVTVARRVLISLGGAVLWGMLVMGCDEVSQRGFEDGRPPRVLDITVTPATVRAPASAETTEPMVNIEARAEDPDGRVERVEFRLESAAGLVETRLGPLSQTEDGMYSRTLSPTLPVTEDVYSVRVFAVDDDGHASNQAIGQFTVVPES